MRIFGAYARVARSASTPTQSRAIHRASGVLQHMRSAASTLWAEQLIDESFLEARPRSGLFVRVDARPAMAQP
jgi:hypothetical protein